MPVTIVGGGLAGCEAAWQAAEAGVAQGTERDHSGGLSDRGPGSLMLRRDPDMPPGGGPLTRSPGPWARVAKRRIGETPF